MNIAKIYSNVIKKKFNYYLIILILITSINFIHWFINKFKVIGKLLDF